MSAKLRERDRNDVLPGDLVCKDWNARTPEFGIVREAIAVPGRAWPDVVVGAGSGEETRTWHRWDFAYNIDDDAPDFEEHEGERRNRIVSARRVISRGIMDPAEVAKMYGLDASDLEPGS
jgi:hypothetical protein